MPKFELTDAEKAASTGAEHLAMLERLAAFVNDLKTDVDTLKNSEPQNP